MDFVHKREYLNAGDIVEVDCSHQCNIVLVDDTNFENYKRSSQYTHHGGGGFFENLPAPARLMVPSSGYWNIVIDRGRGTATIRPSIRIIKQR